MSAEPIAILRSITGESIPLTGVALNGVAEGCLFDLAVEQHYANRDAATIEAVYTFPLPVRAVLLSFELEIAGRRRSGIVKRKRVAAENYESAVESGDSAALLEQARDGLYTISLGNLKPGETATIRYRYAELLDFDQGRVRIAIPTAVAPRYGRAMLALDPHQVPVTDVLADYPCTLTMTVKGELAAAQVHSPTHALIATAAGPVLSLTTRAGFSLDRDLVLLIEGLKGPAQGVVAGDGEAYVALVSVTAPPLAAGRPRTQNLKLVVDCSGSMAHDSIRQAREALLAVLATLTADDRVSLTRFGTTYEHLTHGLEAATARVLLDLNAKVRALDANLGGTQMQKAVDATLALPVAADTDADVLLITDGEIWEIDALIQRLANARHRLFVIAVGATPAEELARKVAVVTRGACEFVTPREDMRGAVERLLAKIVAPAGTITSVTWPIEPEWSLGVGTPVFPGETVHLVAGFRSQPAGTVRAAVRGADGVTELGCALPAAVAVEATLSRVAAMRRLPSLGDEAAGAMAEAYQLVTEHTSCVVVHERAAADKAAGDPLLRQVPQMLAAGWGGSGTVFRGVSAAPSAAMPRSPPGDTALRGRSAASAPQGVVDDFASFDLYGDVALDPTLEAGPSLASTLESLAARGQALPTTLEELKALGVGEDVLERLRRIIEDGYTERDVVAAWLAVACEGRGGPVARPRLWARISRAATRRLRARVEQALGPSAPP